MRKTVYMIWTWKAPISEDCFPVKPPTIYELKANARRHVIWLQRRADKEEKAERARKGHDLEDWETRKFEIRSYNYIRAREAK